MDVTTDSEQCIVHHPAAISNMSSISRRAASGVGVLRTRSRGTDMMLGISYTCCRRSAACTWRDASNLGYGMPTKSARNQYRILPREIWHEIQRQYLAGRRPAEICRRFGVPRSTLTSRRIAGSWDTQREEFRRIRDDLGSIGPQAGADGRPCLGAQQSDGQHSGVSARERLYRRTPASYRSGARNCGPDAAADGASDLQVAYREFSAVLRHWIELMVGEEAAGCSAGIRPSRIVLDAIRALERLQLAERAALGIEKCSQPEPSNVVIVVPAKLSFEEWQAEAQDNRVRHVKGGTT